MDTRNIRIRYIAALSIVAIAVLFSSFFLNSILKRQSLDADIINKAGMQRMLSQKIALIATRMNHASEEIDVTQMRQQLLDAVGMFQTNHLELTQDRETLSDEVTNQMFGGANPLDERISDYIIAALELVESGTENHGIFSAKNTESLLIDLDKVVSQFELEANKRATTSIELERILVVFILCLLVIEAYFIFIPMEKTIFKKIAQAQRKTREANRLRELADKANATKSEFLAAMSHELRTPLNGISGMIELAVKNPHDYKPYLAKATSSGNHLLILINDLLDISEAENSQLTLERQPFDPVQLLEDCLAPARTNCEAKGIELVYTPSENMPRAILGDKIRLGQIFNHLIGNAVKFTHRGKVTVILERIIDQDRQKILFSVTDTGIGIPQEQRQDIFDTFTQIDGSKSRAYEGTGLGLAICSKLAGAMGGKLSLLSIEGEGSTFDFVFAYTEAQTSEQNLAPEQLDNVSVESPKHAKTILVVEDNDINAEVLMCILEDMGYQVERAENGQIAVDIVKQKTFDLVFMDLSMPVMDGLEATSIIVGELGKTMPIVAFTANTSEADRQQCTRVGMKDFLSKPLDSDSLEAVLTVHLGRG